MEPRQFLRIEGLAALVGALAAYVWLGGSVWLFAALALAPDLSMPGYLAGPRIGSLAYNAVRTYTLPAILAGVGVSTGATIALLVAAVWVGHIGADRLFGYGLKCPSGFRDTHLSIQSVPFEAIDPE